MDNREFLNKIRKMQETGQHIKLTEVSDITLNTNKKNLVEAYLRPSLLTEDTGIDYDAFFSKYNTSVEEQKQICLNMIEAHGFKKAVSINQEYLDDSVKRDGPDNPNAILLRFRLNYLKTGNLIREELGEQEDGGQDISPDEQRDEENAFKDKVSQLVEFEKIKVFTKTVTWSGRLVREGINWNYTLDDKVGCFINTAEDDTLQLTDDMLKVIKDIRAYYDIWSEEWAKRLVGTSATDNETTF